MLSLLLLAAAASVPLPSIDGALHQAVDPCRAAATSSEIVVCRQHDEGSRYRLPPSPDTGFDKRGAVDSVSRERYRLMDGDGLAPDLTRGSCSTVGASGSTGCQIRSWREHDQMKGW